MPNTMDAESLSAKFVDLLGKYGDWQDITKLPPEEVAILHDMLLFDRYEFERLVPGKIKGYFRDQCGSTTGETFYINTLCPYKVISEDDRFHEIATLWLDNLFRYTLLSLPAKNDEQKNAVITYVAKELLKNIPLEPIRLTAYGDELLEYPSEDKHARDNDKVGATPGVHRYCCGWIDRHRATKNHDSLSCRTCNLRVLFPKDIKTYGELRDALKF